jgi:hypothetical protein
MLRPGNAVIVLSVVIVVFAAFVPALASHLSAILTPLWCIFPVESVLVVRREALRCDERPISLLALVLSRAPPRTALF